MQDDAWAHSHETAAALRRALIMLGVRAGDLDGVTSRDDSAGLPRVHIPPLRPDDAQRIIAALTPAPGPAALVGRRDGAPMLPEASQ